MHVSTEVTYGKHGMMCKTYKSHFMRFQQGHNWIIVYSRPAYFCLCCVVIWIFDLSGRSGILQPFSLYGVTFFSAQFLLCVRDTLIG